MQTHRLNTFTRFFPPGVLFAIGAVVGLASGWQVGVLVAIVAAVVGYLTNRVSVRLDDDGVHYTGWGPGAGWSIPWSELTGLYIDQVTTTNEDGGGREHRLSFERAGESPVQVRGFSEASCRAMLAAFESRGLGANYDDSRVKGR